MFDPLSEFAFASDPVRLTVLGIVLWCVAAWAGIMEKRRHRKRPLDRLERVGWMPWTSIFLAAAFLGTVLLALGVPLLLAEA